jgi:mono/diheme cytochrome c family protein
MIFGLTAAALATLPAAAQQPASQAVNVGATEYVGACAVCHGATGKGDGPIARYLNVVPADLTQLKQKNGGEFPFYKIFLMVDGRTLEGAHGTRAMPVWGHRFAAEAGDRYGPYGAETMIRGRIVEMVRHLETLQE